MENYSIEGLDRPVGALGVLAMLIRTRISYYVLNKAELFAKKLVSVSSTSNLSAEFLTRRATFKQQHSQPVVPSSESMKQLPTTTRSTLCLNLTSLRKALRQCKKYSSGCDDRLTYELPKESQRNATEPSSSSSITFGKYH